MKHHLFESCRVKAKNVADFLDTYYRDERYRARGPEYAAALLASHEADFAKFGYDVISRHESVTGRVVAYFGDNATDVRTGARTAPAGSGQLNGG